MSNIVENREIAGQLLGCLIQEPTLIINAEKTVTHEDFAFAGHKILFGVLQNLYMNGIVDININEIANYIDTQPSTKTMFDHFNCMELYHNLPKNANIANYEYYFDITRKFTLLRELQKYNFDISHWYVPSQQLLDFELRERKMKELENATIQDIIHSFSNDINFIESKFIDNKSLGFATLGGDLAELMAELEEAPAQGFKLQADIINTVVRGGRPSKVYLYSAGTSVGKAIVNSEKIPTPIGWRTIGDIKQGDYVFDAFGKPTKVLKIFPQGKKDVWKVTFKDGREVLCSDDHLWSYNSPNQRTESIKSRKFFTKTTKELYDIGVKGKSGYNFRVPKTFAVEYAEQELPIDPYIFGLMLGDGSFREQPDSKSFSFSSETEELPKRIAEVMNWSYKRNSLHNYTYTFSNIEEAEHKKVWVSDVFKDLPEMINLYSAEKFIPDIYKYNTKENRLKLIQGLIDTDGSVGKDGSVTFFSSSVKLMNDVKEILYSLGYIVMLLKDERKENTNYRLTITSTPEEKLKLATFGEKKNRLHSWYNSNVTKEKNIHTPIISIEKLDYQEDMTCFLVDNEEHLFLVGDYIVTHNTRYFLGQAAAMSMPLTYNWEELCWEQTGGNHKVLFITTELERDELQTMLLAYVTNINEDHILNGGQTLNAEQREVLKQGIQIVNYFQDNLYMLYMPSPNNEQIDSAVRRLTMVHKFEAVIFDYIHVSGDLLKEFGTVRVREDTALLLMATTLKNLANELNIFIYTGTQLNAASQQSTREDNAEFGSEAMIRGARAIADKVDIGMIARRTTDPLIQKVQQIIEAKGCTQPNRYIDVYKNRRGKHTMIRIWQNADLGTMKFHDLFVTDAYNTLVELDTILEIEEEEISVEEVLANVR